MDQFQGNRVSCPVSQRAAHLRIGVLKRPVRGHVFDNVGQNGVDLTFLRAGEKGDRKCKFHMIKSVTPPPPLSCALLTVKCRQVNSTQISAQLT